MSKLFEKSLIQIPVVHAELKVFDRIYFEGAAKSKNKPNKIFESCICIFKKKWPIPN